MSKILGILTTVVLVASLVVASAGCKASPDPWESMTLSFISVEHNKISVAVDASANLTINAIYSTAGLNNLPGNGGLRDVTANSTFLSKDDNIATVTSGGQVRGIVVGSTSVTVSYTEGNVTKTVVVPVTVTKGEQPIPQGV